MTLSEDEIADDYDENQIMKRPSKFSLFGFKVWVGMKSFVLNCILFILMFHLASVEITNRLS